MTHQHAYQLDVDVRRVGPVAVVTICGSAGMNEAELLQVELSQLADEPKRLIVVDMEGLDMLNPTQSVAASGGKVLYWRTE